ncbi:hypothetical protein [Acinetobacter rudis]|uniref:Uncharacterized protein n=1 Tax=Acinetobacter rudis CIP 110305 TaxID=421052 RepID=S3MXK9_9GAMM|nr:hypothetical protein [Acinetobacter rudis]EPF72147.1 hypothetical protein F945_02199 [Acinetobacter rudis CIP 110305]
MVDNNDFSPLNIPSLDNEVKMCSADELLDPLLCNSIVKILNYHTTVPYTFNMNQSQWSKVKNKYPFEHDLAIRFGLEFDLRQFNESMLGRYSFHTMMYLRFTMYAQKHSLDDGGKFIIELSKDTLKARVAISKRNFGEVVDLSLSNASKPVLAGNAIAMHANRGPYYINENLYRDIFGRSYDPAMRSHFIQQYQYSSPISGF